MQIVINLEDEIYEDIKYRYDKNQLTLGAMVLELSILHGEILPKGHGDLIDRNALITELETDYHNTLTESGAHLFVEITNYIDEAETIVEADKENDK